MGFAYDDHSPAFLDPSELATRTPADALLDLIAAHRPAWMADALCREHPEISWFPQQGEPVRAAREICGRCLVVAECSAAGASEHFGVWGGLSERQRKIGRRGR